MGTRFLLGIVKDGEYVVGHAGSFDGQIDYQGVNILDFLKNKFDKDIFSKGLNNISIISEEEEINRWENLEAIVEKDYIIGSSNSVNKYYELYPENSNITGAKELLEIIQESDKELKMHNEILFANDSVFCEWCYIIDLDKLTFEIYAGINNRLPNKEERFHTRFNDIDPVNHLTTFSIFNLPEKVNIFLDIVRTEYNSKNK